jgi:hypothetical protein
MARSCWARIRALVIKFVTTLVVQEPILVKVGAHRFYVNPHTGRLMPTVAGGDGEGEGEEGGEGEGEGAGDEEGGEGEGEGAGEPDWKKESRKHERRAKAAQKRAEDLQKQIDDAKTQNAPAAEKAIEDAKKAARDEALAEAAKERRQDRLDVAVTRLAAKGVKAGDEDGVKFADTEDALLWVQRRIESGDIDADEIFDDQGKVQTTALTEALGEILEEKPHLKATGESGSEGGKKKAAGDSDAGKGKGAAGQLSSTEGMTAEQIAEALEKGLLKDYLASSN